MKLPKFVIGKKIKIEAVRRWLRQRKHGKWVVKPLLFEFPEIERLKDGRFAVINTKTNKTMSGTYGYSRQEADLKCKELNSQ